MTGTPTHPYRRPSSLRYYQDGPPTSVDLEEWRLQVGGRGITETILDFGQLARLAHVKQDRRMVCVCTWSVRHTWGGVLLSTLLDHLGWDRRCSGAFLRQTSMGTPEKGTYSSTIRLLPAIERSALLVDTIDGQPLTLERGFPIRLIDFALYGYKGVKGVSRLEVCDEFDLGHWEAKNGYDVEGTIRPKRYRACDLGHSVFADRPGEITTQ